MGHLTRERRHQLAVSYTPAEAELSDDVEYLLSEYAVAKQDSERIRRALTAPGVSPRVKEFMRESASAKRRRLEEAGEVEAAALYADLVE